MCDRGDCGKKFCKKSDLSQHLDLHDNNLIKCHFCPWGAPGGQTHRTSTHYDQHFNMPNFLCSECGQKFFRKKGLLDHFEIYHEKVLGKYKCKICDYKTYSRLSLGQHILKIHKLV